MSAKSELPNKVTRKSRLLPAAMWFIIRVLDIELRQMSLLAVTAISTAVASCLPLFVTRIDHTALPVRISVAVTFAFLLLKKIVKHHIQARQGCY